MRGFLALVLLLAAVVAGYGYVLAAAAHPLATLAIGAGVIVAAVLLLVGAWIVGAQRDRRRPDDFDRPYLDTPPIDASMGHGVTIVDAWRDR